MIGMKKNNALTIQHVGAIRTICNNIIPYFISTTMLIESETLRS